MHTIQSLSLPNLDVCSEKELYLHSNEFAWFNKKERFCTLSKGGRIVSDTYFNSLSVGKWKKYTQIDKLYALIDAEGKFKISWKLNRLHNSTITLDEQFIKTSEREITEINLSFWDRLEDGMLFYELISLEDDLDIFEIQYATDNKPEREVNLAIVMTHFNRQRYIIPATERLKSRVLNENIHLYIIDNSQNLDISASKEVTLIRNKNLGGSGGFTRGLIEVKKERIYTHCLFMDDDASCEAESIFRTFSFLSYCHSDQIAIAGALLREAEQYRLFENGAQFRGICKPINNGISLKDVESLLHNELEQDIDYGAWWFFAFPLKHTTHNAFPFFIRGDDISFCLSHNFTIITLNGVCSWQDDFDLKNGPLPIYLDTRNHLLQLLQGFMPSSRYRVIMVAIKMYLRNALSYQYETAEASTRAINDVLKGSKFWAENADMLKVRPEILNMNVLEKVKPISDSDLFKSKEINNLDEIFIRKMIRFISFNGHILPNLIFKKDRILQRKGYDGILRQIFMRKEILYYHGASKLGYRLKINRIRFFKGLLDHIHACLRLTFNYNKLRSDYTNSYSYLTSDHFWETQFQKNDEQDKNKPNA